MPFPRHALWEEWCRACGGPTRRCRTVRRGRWWGWVLSRPRSATRTWGPWNVGTDNPPVNKHQFQLSSVSGIILSYYGPDCCQQRRNENNPACLPREVNCVEEVACVETVNPGLSTVRHQQQVVQRAEVESVATQSWPGLHWGTVIYTSYIHI